MATAGGAAGVRGGGGEVGWRGQAERRASEVVAASRGGEDTRCKTGGGVFGSVGIVAGWSHRAVTRCPLTMTMIRAVSRRTSGRRPGSRQRETSVVGEVLDVVGATPWDEPLVSLPDRAAVALYLRGRGLSESAAHDASLRVATPLRVTKRGSLVWARRRARD
ncbi:hypothetical protein ACIBO2_11095 [Nonomuraea sp. NPDC050022]|uniref:hypothetical protein n=1 Tax=unclassified Nonomuraea TaxID=2593643 RepID=UPI0033F1D240